MVEVVKAERPRCAQHSALSSSAQMARGLRFPHARAQPQHNQKSRAPVHFVRNACRAQVNARSKWRLKLPCRRRCSGRVTSCAAPARELVQQERAGTYALMSKGLLVRSARSRRRSASILHVHRSTRQPQWPSTMPAVHRVCHTHTCCITRDQNRSLLATIRGGAATESLPDSKGLPSAMACCAPRRGRTWWGRCSRASGAFANSRAELLGARLHATQLHPCLHPAV